MQRFINALVIVLFGVTIYYGIIVDHDRIQFMKKLEASDVELQGHKKVIDEDYRRLTLRFDGRGKHIQKLQNDLVNLGRRLRTISDSLGNQIEETRYRLEQSDEVLRNDLRTLRADLRGLTDDLTTYRRQSNRSILDVQAKITRMEDDIEAIDRKVNPEKYETQEQQQ